MTKIKTAMLIDNEDLDNFINQKILENHGVSDIVTFKNAREALLHLTKGIGIYQMILVDLHMPIIDGFEFIDQFYKLKLNEKHGQVCLLSSSINPLDKVRCLEKNVKFIEKPLSIKELF